jgi:hypothetical protein
MSYKIVTVKMYRVIYIDEEGKDWPVIGPRPRGLPFPSGLLETREEAKDLLNNHCHLEIRDRINRRVKKEEEKRLFQRWTMEESKRDLDEKNPRR